MLPLLLLLLVIAPSGGLAWSLSSPSPRFAVVSADRAREGKGQLDALEAGAEAEGFLDRVLGTNCFSQAVGELASDCRRLEQEGKSRLALHLMNCQLAVQQGATFPCPRRQSIKECTEVLPDRAYALFVEFLTHADSMCLYIQNQNFEKYTENMLNRLAEGAGLAKEQLAAVAKSTGALGRDTAALQRKAEAALGLLRQHSELEEESLKLQKKARAEMQSYYMSLDAKQQAALEAQDASLEKQAALEAGQAAVLRMLGEAEGHLGGLFQLVEGRAAELAAAAGRQAEAQRALAGELGSLADSSKGIRSAVDVVLGYQQRSDSVLMRLLGKSYTLEDAAFYAAGLLAALAASASPATAGAKLPVMALMGVSLVGERLLLDHLHLWMDLGADGEILLNLPPLPSWLPLLGALSGGSGQPLQLNFKWAVRRAAAAVGAAVLLYCLVSYRDYERESYRLLRRLEDEQRRRHDDYVALMNRHKIELAALLGGNSSGSQEGRALHSGKRGRLVEGEHAAHLAAPLAGGRQLALMPAGGTGRSRVAAAEEEGEEENGWEDSDDDEQQQHQHNEQAAATGRQQHRALATPARQEQPRAAGRPKSAPVRHTGPAAAPAGRKRAPTEDGEAAGGAGKAKRRGGTGRRSSAADEAEADGDAMAVDGPDPATEEAAGGSRRQQHLPIKRVRRGSAEVAAAGSQGAAPKRARRS